METKILVAVPSDRRSALLKSLDGTQLQIILAEDSREALQKLSGETSYDLLLSDAEFPDGSWRDLLGFILESKIACEMIVCSRCPDEELWAEVLQCGVYDLLVEPYERQEVHRIIQSALDSRYMRRFSGVTSAARAS